MAERYTRIASLPENRYAAGSPVILEAGALLRDNKTGKLLAQLKFCNVGTKPIKLLTVEVVPLDAMGRELGAPIRYQYLDLSAERDCSFGTQQAIALPDAAAREFRVRIVETGYGDNTLSGAVDAPWEAMPAPEPIAWADRELEKQFHIRYGSDWKQESTRFHDLWFCPCGHTNRAGESTCHTCSAPFFTLTDANLQALTADKEARLAAEAKQREAEAARHKAQQEEQERLQKEAAARAAALAAARKKRNTKIAAAAALAITVVLVVTKVIIPYSKYQKAVTLMNSGEYEQAIAAFEAMAGYRDSEEQIESCKTEIKNISYNEAVSLKEAGKYEQAIAAFEAMAGYKDSEEQIESCKFEITNLSYNSAVALKNAGDYEEAISIFTALGDFKDSIEQVKHCKYSSYEELEKTTPLAAAIGYGKLGTYLDSKERSSQLWNQLAVRETVSAGNNHTVGLKADGTVAATGYNSDGRCDVSDRKDIVAVSAGDCHTVGLKADGTVAATGYHKYGQCNVTSWKDIVAVSAGLYHTVGLKADGTVVATGSNKYGQCDVTDWKDIVVVSAGSSHTVGLKADGTVVATGYNKYGQCDVSVWKDIVAVSAGSIHTVGLKADGTVVATGSNSDGQCDVSVWKDIVAVSVGRYHTVGLKADGTVVAAGDNHRRQCDVSGWKDIMMPQPIECIKK